MKWNIGCSGFYNPHWKGVFYPEDLPQSKWLSFYSEHLNALELNVTFYRFPTPELLKGWFNKTSSDFNFSVKAPRMITHFKKFNDCKQLLDDFYSACDNGLKNKLNTLLFQLPPGIQYSEEKLEQIISSLHPGFKNVLEFRHDSWWKEEVYDRLSKRNITFCSISHPALPATLINNTNSMYIRMHGVPHLFHSNYSSGDLKKLYANLNKQKNQEAISVYFNNTATSAGILNVREFTKKTNG